MWFLNSGAVVRNIFPGGAAEKVSSSFSLLSSPPSWWWWWPGGEPTQWRPLASGWQRPPVGNGSTAGEHFLNFFCIFRNFARKTRFLVSHFFQLCKVMITRWQQSCEAPGKSAFDWLLLGPSTPLRFINRSASSTSSSESSYWGAKYIYVVVVVVVVVVN